jgi:hypothetical protein
MNKLLLAVLAVALSACATSQQEKVGSIAATPLNDLNVGNTVIPPVLQKAKAQPYAMPADMACATLQAEVDLLDVALGADIDEPEPESDNSGSRAEKVVGGAALGAMQRTVEGAIPFRGWLRKLSGAERHARDVAAAITAGSVRRGFLKGIAVTRACGRAQEARGR